MKRCFRLGVMAVAAAAIQANALDVTLAPSGEVRFGGDASPCVLRPAAALPGWRSLSCKGGWTIEKPGVAAFDMLNGTNALVRAVATIEQLPDGKARISLALANPESFKVYELETSGRRLGTLPSEVRGGRLEFTASVPGTHGARILYEIAQ